MFINAKSPAAKFCMPGIAATVLPLLLWIGLVSLGGLLTVGGSASFAQQTDTAQASWRKEFDAVCARTEDAMTFSEDELTKLIRRCDELQPQIEKLDESQKKVFLERLRKCRGLYAYVLDSKRKDKEKK